MTRRKTTAWEPFDSIAGTGGGRWRLRRCQRAMARRGHDASRLFDSMAGEVPAVCGCGYTGGGYLRGAAEMHWGPILHALLYIWEWSRRGLIVPQLFSSYLLTCTQRQAEQWPFYPQTFSSEPHLSAL